MPKILIDKMQQGQPKTIYQLAQERGCTLDEAYRAEIGMSLDEVEVAKSLGSADGLANTLDENDIFDGSPAFPFLPATEYVPEPAETFNPAELLDELLAEPKAELAKTAEDDPNQILDQFFPTFLPFA